MSILTWVLIFVGLIVWAVLGAIFFLITMFASDPGSWVNTRRGERILIAVTGPAVWFFIGAWSAAAYKKKGKEV